ncbi:hypothetical protein [Kutzneria sp. NPDC052558]|uniref:hypothetical protein n=1 Tax=Kutzneria sp. NPDC052558 TaxID=3364121 RepID=UPI0037C8061A
MVSVGLTTTDEGALDDWYRTEHIPLLHRIPGWFRTRRYRLTSGAGPALLALHEISDLTLFTTLEYREATTTDRRAAVMQHVTRRERRLFAFHRAVTT